MKGAMNWRPNIKPVRIIRNIFTYYSVDDKASLIVNEVVNII